MRRKQEKVLHSALILLTASLFVVQLVGIRAGTGHPPAKAGVLVADGPTPKPGPPQIPNLLSSAA